MKLPAKLALFLAILCFGWCCPALAQSKKGAAQAAPAAAPQQQAEPAQPNVPPQPGWVARCTSASRESPPECAMEETAVLTKTGQLVVLVNLRITSDTRTPVILVQLPLGLDLPAGIKLQVDEGKTLDIQIQTCENRGCYASMPVPGDFLTALKSGKQLKVSFQNLGKETIAIPMPLADFGAAYDKIK